MDIQELTDAQKAKFSKEITKSRKKADSWVFGYKKKEMLRGNEIVTLAKGEQGAGWFVVGSCKIKR